MASILPDFEYDIFISYRHNDNKSGWVTEFVKALQEELAATIKEPISVYFDSNPNDGLLETHNVDKSLEGKLKCLIFIPILSQTYCDPKSFAWQHEFCAFNKLAKEDQFGRDIKLSNGNVASRILPIKIHDLDAEDKILIENEIGGVLRAIEFIFKSSGVNRSLTSKDDEVRSQGKILYRDQVNKVANAIKEIVSALKSPVSSKSTANNYHPSSAKASEGKSKTKFILAGIIILTLLPVGYFLYPKFVSSHKQEEVIDKSIAVLPFVNMSSDPEQEYFSDGISEELLNLLSKVPELKVIGRTSSFAFKGKNEDLRTIGEKLGVSHLLEGSIRKSNNTVRITAQLIKVSDGSHMWSQMYDREMNDIFIVQDEISADVVEQLKLKLLPLNIQHATMNKEAYQLMLRAKFEFEKSTTETGYKSLEIYNQALALAPNNGRLWGEMAQSYATRARFGQGELETDSLTILAREAALKSIELDPTRAEGHSALSYLAQSYDWDVIKANAEADKALALDPNNILAIINKSGALRAIGNAAEHVKMLKRAEELDPLNANVKVYLSIFYLFDGKGKDALTELRKADELNPSRAGLHYLLARVYLIIGDADKAFEEMQKEKDAGWFMYGLPAVLFSQHKIKEADEALADLITKRGHDRAFRVAEVYAWRGEKDKAFGWLEHARVNHDQSLFANIKSNSWLKKLMKDPRYPAFLKKLNLPE